MGKAISKNKDRAAASKTKQLEKRLERRNIAFDALFRFFEKLGTTFDQDKIVRLFLMTLMGQLMLRRISLYLVDPTKKRLVVYHSLGVGRPAVPDFMEAGSAFVMWLKKSSDPVHIDKFFTVRCADDERMDSLNRLVEKGFSYAFPLVDQEEFLGAVFYSGKVTGGNFSEFDNELMRMLSKVASITFRNAALYRAAVLSKLELEKFSKVKKEFINHTSHELRTPITVLKSALWSVETAEVEEGVLIDLAKDAVLRMQSKIEQLLSLNDIELNETVLSLQPADISSLLEDCLREVIPELEEKRVTVEVDDRARYREVMVDPAKMKLVLRSLINNAVNFVERGGNISITVSVSNEEPGSEAGIEIDDWNADVESTAPGVTPVGAIDERPGSRPSSRCGDFKISGGGSYLVIHIKDDGIGIPADEIRFLAEPFRRASNSTLRDVKGLGVGLSVSKKIVSCHGGRLYCRSDEGRGSEFSIWLRLDE